MCMCMCAYMWVRCVRVCDVCMYVCVCGSARVCSPVYEHVEVRVLSSILLHIIFWNRVCHSTWNASVRLVWLAMVPPESTCHTATSAGVTAALLCSVFYVVVGDPACTASTFPTGHPPSPRLSILIRNLKAPILTCALWPLLSHSGDSILRAFPISIRVPFNSSSVSQASIFFIRNCFPRNGTVDTAWFPTSLQSLLHSIILVYWAL